MINLNFFQIDQEKYLINKNLQSVLQQKMTMILLKFKLMDI